MLSTKDKTKMLNTVKGIIEHYNYGTIIKNEKLLTCIGTWELEITIEDLGIKVVEMVTNETLIEEAKSNHLIKLISQLESVI